jgi:hypothetical protein
MRAAAHDAARVRTALVHDKLLGGQHGGIDRPVQAREPVIRSHDEQELFPQHRDRRHAWFVDGQREQGQVGHSSLDPAKEPRRAAHRDLHFDVWMVPPEFAQQSRQDVQRDGHPADDVDRAAEALVLIDDRGAGLPDIREDTFGKLQHGVARRGQLDSSAEPDEQRLVDFVLEQQHLPADGGLRQMQLDAGPGEGAGVGNGANDLELTQVHGGVLAKKQKRPSSDDDGLEPVSRGELHALHGGA